MARTVAYYLDLPYTIELRNTPGEGWFVRVKELPGCMSQGETAEEALAMIQDAMRGWLEVALEHGDPIPEPRPEEEYSGKFVVRVPRSLHRELVAAADLEGVSLNQYINTVLAQAVGRAMPTYRSGRPTLADVLDPLIRRFEETVQRLELALAGRATLPFTQDESPSAYSRQKRGPLAIREDRAEYEAAADQPGANRVTSGPISGERKEQAHDR